MAHVFISHSETDAQIAQALASGLEDLGYTTWYYERDSVPGLSYLVQTGQAIRGAGAVLVVISPASLASIQVTKEVVRAHEENRPFVPVLHGVTHAQFQEQQQEWREAVGSAASVSMPAEGPRGLVSRLARGLEALGVRPGPPAPSPALPPAAPRAEAPLPAAAEGDRSAPSAAPGRRVRLVMVEDEPDMGDIVKAFLARAGYDVAVATDGAPGLELIRRLRPDLVTTDLMLPSMNGFDLIRQVRADPAMAATPVLVLTALSDGATRDRCLRLGPPLQVLTKPFVLEQLMAALSGLRQQPATAPGPGPVARPARQPDAAERPRDAAPLPASDLQTLRDCECVFTDRCRRHLAALRMTEEALLELVQGEFRSHLNYFHFDLENYPLPLRSGYIAFINKTGPRIEFAGVTTCTADQAKLASWGDILALYRRATRLAYRADPEKVLLVDGALSRVVGLHLDLRTRITKHFSTFDDLPLQARLLRPEAPPDATGGDPAVMTDEIAYHLRESARADEEASAVGEAFAVGDLELREACGAAVMELERSLQHIHKIITAYPPVT